MIKTKENHNQYLKKKIIPKEFFENDVLQIAPQLIGKTIIVKDSHTIFSFIITETEAYRGEEDQACHCHKGKTKRTEIMYHKGGVYYVYLIYGMYWMLNVVTGKPNQPQAVLIRGIKQVDKNGNFIKDINGPGRVSKALGVDRSLYGQKCFDNKRIEICNKIQPLDSYKIVSAPRIGIDYAGEEWINKHWRFIMKRV